VSIIAKNAAVIDMWLVAKNSAVTSVPM